MLFIGIILELAFCSCCFGSSIPGKSVIYLAAAISVIFSCFIIELIPRAWKITITYNNVFHVKKMFYMGLVLFTIKCSLNLLHSDEIQYYISEQSLFYEDSSIYFLSGLFLQKALMYDFAQNWCSDLCKSKELFSRPCCFDKRIILNSCYSSKICSHKSIQISPWNQSDLGRIW